MTGGKTMKTINEVSAEECKELICQMIRKLDDGKFLKQIYGIVYRQLHKK